MKLAHLILTRGALPWILFTSTVACSASRPRATAPSATSTASLPRVAGPSEGEAPAQTREGGNLAAGPVVVAKTIDPELLREMQENGVVVVDFAGLTGEAKRRAERDGKSADPRSRLTQIAHLEGLAGKLETIPFAVDPTMDRLRMTVEGPAEFDVTLIDPRGQRVTPARRSPGHRNYTIVTPTQGQWRLEVRGAAGAPIEANIQAMTSFEPRVDVKVLGGRAGHQGHFSLQAQPWLGEELLLVVEDRMGAPQIATLQFGIARSESEVHWLETQLLPSEEGGSEALWWAPVAFRRGDRVFLRGTLADGGAFMRQASAVRPSPFNLRPSEETKRRLLTEDQVPFIPTRWQRFTFELARRGGEGTVQVEAPRSHPDLEFRIEPAALELKDGETRAVALFIRAKQERASKLKSKRAVSVVLSVGSADHTDARNTFTLTGSVDIDTDHDGVADTTENGYEDGFDGNRDGIADFKQPAVASFGSLLQRYSVVLPPGAVMGGASHDNGHSDPLPNNARDKYGRWQISVVPEHPVAPPKLQFFVRGQKPELLWVRGPAGTPWKRRARFNAGTQSFTLNLDASERKWLLDGTLWLAPSYL